MMAAHGDTPEEAIAEAQVAIELWIETAKERGIPVPKPRYRPAIYAAAKAGDGMEGLSI